MRMDDSVFSQSSPALNLYFLCDGGMMFKGKTIVLGICGGIAAYKVVEVASRLRKLNADVHVIMTEHATEFVTPLTFQSICGNPVTTSMFDEPVKWEVEHISLARKADLILVAPATANIIGKIACGIADDMLSTTIMATKSPVLFVPAMNHAMYDNSIVQDNIGRLLTHGYRFMEPDTGLMAAEGEYGKGRLPEPARIVEEVQQILYPKKDLEGLHILVTAGPTQEAIDPVRYISNHSSGKMGYAVAEAAVLRGAKVKLITGPVHLPKPPGTEMISVISTLEMQKQVMKHYTDCQVVILVAAVADYRCAEIADRKLKKTGEDLSIQLVQNPDIAKELSRIKGDRLLIGTCAETNDLVENALKKVQAKNFDLIMANDVTLEGAGFGVDTNIVKIIGKDGSIKDLPILPKTQVAHELLDEIVKLVKS
jgi:phosphopantothenoylcysteine decarboxylase / phosphopantothenate---cysteine ligase